MYFSFKKIKTYLFRTASPIFFSLFLCLAFSPNTHAAANEPASRTPAAALLCSEGTSTCPGTANSPALGSQERIQRYLGGEFSAAGHGFTLPGSCQGYDRVDLQKQFFGLFVNELTQNLLASGLAVKTVQARIWSVGSDRIDSDEPWTNQLGKISLDYTLANGTILDAVVTARRVSRGFFNPRNIIFDDAPGFNVGFVESTSKAFNHDGSLASSKTDCQIYGKNYLVNVINRATGVSVYSVASHDFY